MEISYLGRYAETLWIVNSVAGCVYLAWIGLNDSHFDKKYLVRWFGNVTWLRPVWPDWAIYCTLGNFLKHLEKLIWPNLPHSKAIFVKVWIWFWATFIDFGIFFLVTLVEADFGRAFRLEQSFSISKFLGNFVFAPKTSVTLTPLLLINHFSKLDRFSTSQQKNRFERLQVEGGDHN